MAGGSGLVLMPTGGGKSLCFQIPALCRPGIGVVISPLIALMQDQVAALRQQGVAAAALHSDLTPEERREIGRELSDGKLKLLYVSPERLLLDGTLDRLDHAQISLFAIDEAHCVSQWGHHFRPEYRNLSVLAERFGWAPRLALTATADPRTVEDIRRQLSLTEEPVFRGGFDRPNIFISAEPRESERAQLRAFVKQASDGAGAGIIYCGSRKKTEETAAWLCADGYDALAFHAGMAPEDKRSAHERFARGDAVIMAATIAFGMGIDRPDVRWVAHTDLPRSPESWYQEIGRAGRDGLPARALLLYGAGDIALARHRIAESPATDDQKRIEHRRLDAMVAIAEAATCRRALLLRCFGEEDVPERCGTCDICANPPKLFDGTIAAQKMLSAVLRTGRRFGAGHIIDVLRGKLTDKVAQFSHDTLPTFGVGKELSEQAWRGVARQLVARGILDVAVENHGELVPTEAARPVLKGETSVMLHADALKASASAPRRANAPLPAASLKAAEERDWQGIADTAGGAEAGRFAALRAWRRLIAQQQGVPPYVVFQDRTLSEIAQQQPASMHELAGIPGVGATKLERYGDEVLSVLKAIA